MSIKLDHTRMKPTARLALASLVLALLQLGVSARIGSQVAQGAVLHPLGPWLGIGHEVHRVALAWLLLLQALCLVPALAALCGWKPLRWWPVWVVPGIVANGVEAAVQGFVRNGLVLGSLSPMSLGDLWVLGALAVWMVAQVARR